MNDTQKKAVEKIIIKAIIGYMIDDLQSDNYDEEVFYQIDKAGIFPDTENNDIDRIGKIDVLQSEIQDKITGFLELLKG